jgi:hypothetical protein
MKQLKTLMFITTLIIPFVTNAEIITSEELNQFVSETDVTQRSYKLHAIIEKMSKTVNTALNALGEKVELDTEKQELNFALEDSAIAETNNKLHNVLKAFADEYSSCLKGLKELEELEEKDKNCFDFQKERYIKQKLALFKHCYPGAVKSLIRESLKNINFLKKEIDNSVAGITWAMQSTMIN